MSGSGVGAMVQWAARLSTELDMEVIDMSRQAEDPPGSCTCELAGDHLLFTISLISERILVAAQVMDRPDPPDFFLKIEDNPAGWDIVFRLVRSMVENQVRSLERPIMVGEVGQPDAWIIA